MICLPFKLSNLILFSGNSAAIVTTHAAVEPAPESIPSSPEPEPVSKKSVNIPVEHELESTPESDSDPELEDNLQPVSSSNQEASPIEGANDPDDEPLDMLISKEETGRVLLFFIFFFCDFENPGER